jgi:hypothetical protein
VREGGGKYGGGEGMWALAGVAMASLVCTGTTKGAQRGGEASMPFTGATMAHCPKCRRRGTYVQRAGWDSKF